MKVKDLIRDLIDSVDDLIFYLRRRLSTGTLSTELADLVKETPSEVHVRASWPVAGVVIPICRQNIVGLKEGECVLGLVREGHSLVLDVRKKWFSTRVKFTLHLIPPIHVTTEEVESALALARKYNHP